VNFTPSGSILIGKGLYIHGGATFDNTGGSLTGTGIIVNNGTFLGNLSPSAEVSLGGSGAFAGTRTIAAGATITPGESPGTQTVANEIWATGGNYLWEINDVDGGIGVDPGWDWLNVTSQLNITATGGGKFNILLTSLTLSNGTGFVHDFNQFSNYSWTIASAGGGVTGFNSSAFNLNTSAFQNSFGGTFGIALVGNDLALTYSASAVPEPGSFLLVGAAAAGMAWRRKRRGKKRSPDPVPTDTESTGTKSSE
jgi:hypothetical protein